MVVGGERGRLVTADECLSVSPSCFSSLGVKGFLRATTGPRQELIPRVSWSVELEAHRAQLRRSCHAGNASGIPGSGKRARAWMRFLSRSLLGGSALVPSSLVHREMGVEKDSPPPPLVLFL